MDVVTIPERLDKSVCEPKEHQIIHGLLSQIMIDADDIFFGKATVQNPVQCASRFEIVAERLFDDDTRPLPAARCCQVLDYRSKEKWRNSQIMCWSFGRAKFSVERLKRL